MAVPKINSAHGSETRNIINRAIEVLNSQGKAIQDLVAEGQLTEKQYAELITVINGLIKSGHVDKNDLTPEFKDEIEGFNTRLAQTAEQVTNLDDKKIDKTGSISVGQIDKNKGKLDQTYMTDEFLQQIAGETPINATPPNLGITRVKLAENAISSNKVDFIKKSSNLFNVDESTKGININGYGDVVDGESYSVSTFIEVTPSKEYYFYGFLSLYMYDENMSFLRRRYLTTSGQTHAVDNDTFYIKVSYQHTSSIEERQINEGVEKLPFEEWFNRISDKVEVKKLAINSVESTNIKNNAIGVEKIDFMKKSTNLFNIDNVIERKNILSSGEIIDSTSYNLSDFYKVTPSHDYSFYGILLVAQFDENKNFIERTELLSAGETIKTNKKTRFIRVSYQPNADYPERRFNKGSVLLPYEPFYTKFEDNFNLGALNEVIDKEKDRIMFDVSIDGVFGTNETYADYTDFNNTTSEQVYTMFDDLMAQHSDYVTKEFLGNDSIGNPISVYKFKPALPNTDINTKIPKVFINCGIHGYEHMSTLATYLLMKQMCEKWEDYPLLEALRFNIEFLIIPVSNPSGWDLYQRRNVNDVDLNRDFPDANELETQYIISIIDNNPDIDVMIDFHNFHDNGTGDYFTWIPSPNAYLQHLSQNFFSRMTRKWRKDFSFIPSNDYFVGYASTGATNTASTYARNKGIKHSTTFEICNRWILDENGTINDQNTCKAGVEALANFLLINFRELTR